jgi:hypothetical protein
MSHALRTQTCTLQLPTTAVEPLGSPVHPLTASTDTNARAVIVARDRDGEVRSITPRLLPPSTILVSWPDSSQSVSCRIETSFAEVQESYVLASRLLREDYITTWCGGSLYGPTV